MPRFFVSLLVGISIRFLGHWAAKLVLDATDAFAIKSHKLIRELHSQPSIGCVCVCVVARREEKRFFFAHQNRQHFTISVRGTLEFIDDGKGIVGAHSI